MIRTLLFTTDPEMMNVAILSEKIAKYTRRLMKSSLFHKSLKI